MGAHLLSEVLVDAQKSRLLVTIKDIGTVHFAWSHLFPSYRLSEEERAEVLAASFAFANGKKDVSKLLV